MIMSPTLRALLARKSYDTAFPVMTANNAPSGYVASFPHTGGDFAQPYLIFDQQATTWAGSWVVGSTGGNPWSCQIQFPSLRKATSYSIRARESGNQFPTTWKLQGSMNGTSFTDIDTRSGVTFAAGELKSFNIASPQPWLYYRLYYDGSTSANLVTLAELDFVFVAS